MNLAKILSLGLLLPCLSAGAADPDDTQRKQFARAYAALTSGQRTKATELVRGLEDYPLYSYYRYYELQRNLHGAASDDVRQFLTAYDGSLLASRLRRDWLKQLGKAGRWQAYLDAYRPQAESELQCWQLTARIETGALEGVIADASRLWLVGKSQPEQCDRAFGYLASEGAINDEMRYARIRLALTNNKPGLAQYLARSITNLRLAATASAWLATHANPEAGLKHPALANDTPRTREIVIHAISRMARTNVDRATNAWTRLADQYAFAAGERGQVQRIIGIAAARGEHPNQIALLAAVPRDAVDDTVEKYRIREGIRLRAWAELAQWTAFDPVGDADLLRWRYWHARALQQLARSDEANAIFEELAKQRDYYGFLSADQLGAEYVMNHRRIAPSAAESTAMTARPGIVRARELFLIDLPYKARREWTFEVDRMSPRDLEVAAHVVNQWGWYDRAILALGKAASYDDLEVRFPLQHEALIRMYAAKRNVPTAVLYAIIRTESAFMDDARSPAGALGLMQVMPATGRETARRIGAALPSARSLLDPGKNVMIGSAYLKQVLDRFDGSFSMAAAAYNAGPHRVRSWLPASGCVPADIWVDTIPFTETRRYVRRASFYAAVYQWRLDEPIARISSRLTAVDAQGMTQQC
ncbi:MAG: transglycosylase SLT domain-containing protein [Gammaproteobacteria bacterium]|jgi:soluble lytic murein transglycosylase